MTYKSSALPLLLQNLHFPPYFLYAYYNVPESVYNGLMSAGSKGGYFNNFIKGRYGDTPIG